MFNRKTHLNTHAVNDAYESDVDVINASRRISQEFSNILEEVQHSNDHVLEELNDSDIEGKRSEPSSGTTTAVPKRKGASIQLTGIREILREDNTPEVDENESKDKANTNFGFDHMSISNFKKIRSNDEEDRPNGRAEVQRNVSQTSILQMRDFNHERPIQTGRNFRKISTIVITPGMDDRYRIKLVDGQNMPDLLIEFDSLHLNPTSHNYYWIEKSRWLKFEEEYNHETKRFDSPHLSPVSVRGITAFRKVFAEGNLMLDINPDTFSDVLNNISDSITIGGTFTEIEIMGIRDALVLKHYHYGEDICDPSSGMPMYHYNTESNSFQRHPAHHMSKKRSTAYFSTIDAIQNKLQNYRLEGHLEPGTEALSVQVGALESLNKTISLFVRLANPINSDGLYEVNVPLRFIFIVFGPKSQEQELLEVGRVFAVMMSNLEFREVGYSADSKEQFLEATKCFVNHSVLVPLNRLMTHDTVAEMLHQMKLYFNLFHAERNQKIIDEMRKEIANNHQDATFTRQGRRVNVSATVMAQGIVFEDENKPHMAPPIISDDTNTELKVSKGRQFLRQCCPPFKYFIDDWKGMRLRFGSDFKDAFTRENAPIVFIGVIFIYFVVMAPAITFGALLNAVNPKMTVTMMLLACGFFQLFYCVLGGQPLEIIGITGPVFAAEKVLGSLSVSLAIDLGAMRLWIGVYVAIFGIIFAAFNGVIVLKHVRRSVEEIYNFLVAAIYVLSALFNMFKILPYAITTPSVNGSNIQVIAAERQKFGIGGSTLFLSFFMANFCLILVGIKKGSFFRRKIRNLLGSLNVPLGIILIIAMVNIFFGVINLPTLNVPPSNQVDFSLWFNIPSAASLLSVTPTGHGLCILISVCIFAIITLEISCNSIMATKIERKLLKPSFFSINLFYTHVFFPLLSGILGWPFVSGGTVRSHIHCMSMAKWSIQQPGVPSKIIGSAEQRISGGLVGFMVLISVFLGSALRYIPMASMYGMFLYMGVMGAIDLVMIRRLINLLQRRKYWEGVDYLRDFPTWHIGIFILIQVFFIGILILLSCLSEFANIGWAPILFSVTILVFGFLRGFILPKWTRLNEHLSKMDKKHRVQLYAERHTREQVVVTLDPTGVNMTVVQTVTMGEDNENPESDHDSTYD